MARIVRIYYHAVFGGLGGLLGWMLFSELVGRDWSWWAAALAGGALIGTMVGYLVVAVDAVLDQAFLRFARFASYGAVLGAVGGGLGFWVGDWANYLLVPSGDSAARGLRTIGSMAARGLGWMLFGFAVGAAQGLAARSIAKLWFGALGGSLGGMIGGAVFAGIIEALEYGTAGYTWGQAFALVILGACIGALIALVEEILKPAAVRVLRGWQEGREYPLVKSANVLGRDESADILLLRDMSIEKKHAVIERQGNQFRLVNAGAPSDQTLVNDAPLHDGCDLHDGDRIQLGNVLLKFTIRGSRSTEEP